MKIMVYKRTHTGDPNKKGEFGCHDCMGLRRKNHYDAVIGIGVLHPNKGDEYISCKITWIGIGPRISHVPTGFKAPIVTFDKFVLLDNDGPLVTKSLHPNKLPREVILYDGRTGYEEAYKDAKKIIDQVMSGEITNKKLSHHSNKKPSQNNCLECRK